jgi:hypothetical protein
MSWSADSEAVFKAVVENDINAVKECVERGVELQVANEDVSLFVLFLLRQ